jgi:hydroxymethylpyrimidine pyrophosphatase-like HAD family hydrolase
MRVVVFSDIDDTLMATARKSPKDDELRPGAHGQDGKVSSFMSRKQWRLWQLLTAQADRLIPVTARSASAYGRIAVNFGPERILNFGASVFLDGETPDPEWHARMCDASQVLRQKDVFAALSAHVKPRYALVKHQERDAAGIPCFVHFRLAEPATIADAREEVQDFLRAAGHAPDFYIHDTDRDITVLPHFVHKRHAVRYLIERQGYANDLVLGLGDHLTDLGFMMACDVLLAPVFSRVGRALKGCAVPVGSP